MKISFGKYKGTSVESLPVTYLKWLGKRLAFVGGGGYLDFCGMPTFVSQEEYHAVMVALDDANGVTPPFIDHAIELQAVLAKPNLKHYVSTPHASVIKSEIEKATGVSSRSILIRCIGRSDQCESDYLHDIDLRPLLCVGVVGASKKQFLHVREYIHEHCDRWDVSDANVTIIKKV